MTDGPPHEENPGTSKSGAAVDRSPGMTGFRDEQEEEEEKERRARRGLDELFVHLFSASLDDLEDDEPVRDELLPEPAGRMENDDEPDREGEPQGPVAPGPEPAGDPAGHDTSTAQVNGAGETEVVDDATADHDHGGDGGAGGDAVAPSAGGLFPGDDLADGTADSSSADDFDADLSGALTGEAMEREDDGSAPDDAAMFPGDDDAVEGDESGADSGTGDGSSSDGRETGDGSMFPGDEQDGATGDGEHPGGGEAESDAEFGFPGDGGDAVATDPFGAVAVEEDEDPGDDDTADGD